MSTVDDLLLWDRNFYANRLGKGTLVREMQTPGVLNNSNNISYAMGLDLGSYRGLPIVEHGGGLFGYRTELLRFPEQKFSVICLCNIANAEPENLARQVANIYLSDKLQPGASVLNPSSKGESPDPATLLLAGAGLFVRWAIPRSSNTPDVHVHGIERQFDGVGSSTEADQYESVLRSRKQHHYI